MGVLEGDSAGGSTGGSTGGANGTADVGCFDGTLKQIIMQPIPVSSEYVPDGQGVHSVLPALGVTVFFGQLSQNSAP